jgi:hypothetical protein
VELLTVILKCELNDDDISVINFSAVGVMLTDSNWDEILRVIERKTKRERERLTNINNKNK